jgi:Zn-dependent protease with chaperone function
MSERPNVILAALLGAASILTALFAAGLAGLGGSGLLGLTTIVIGAFSACIYFLADLQRIPVTPLLLVALAFLSTASFVRAAVAYSRQRRLLSALPLEPIEGPLATVARAAGAAAIYRTPAQRPAAFCFGLAEPQVVVTDGLLERLSPDEQAAAVWHEAQHARVREPLKCLTAQLAARAFFWLPLLADLFERYLLVKELEADRLAAAKTSRHALAGALCEVFGQPTPAGAIGLADYATARVDRLFDPRAPLPPVTRPLRVALSILAALLVAIALAFPAQLDLGESQHLRSMLTTMSLHGLPGMTIGLFVNGLILGCATMTWRRLVRRRS